MNFKIAIFITIGLVLAAIAFFNHKGAAKLPVIAIAIMALIHP